MRFAIVLASVLGLAALCCAQVPIPNRPPGYAVGDADAPVVVEAFFDLMCPDSKAAWPTMKSLTSYYGQKLRFILHTFPLPYHQQAFLTAQAARVIHDVNSTAVFSWVDAIFDAQDNFDNTATADKTFNEVIAMLGQLAEERGIITAVQLVKGLHDATANFKTRVEWKYSCTRGVAATPTFLVNGVAVAADPTWTVADWRSVLDPIFSANSVHPAFCKAPQHRIVLADPKLQDCPVDQTVCNFLPGKSQCCTPGEICIPNVGCRC